MTGATRKGLLIPVDCLLAIISSQLEVSARRYQQPSVVDPLLLTDDGTMLASSPALEDSYHENMLHHCLPTCRSNLHGWGSVWVKSCVCI